MDCRTGELYKMNGDEDMQEFLRQMEQNIPRRLLPLTLGEVKELEPLSFAQRKNNMRNKQCPCGSKVKFKRCCWSKYS